MHPRSTTALFFTAGIATTLIVHDIPQVITVTSVLGVSTFFISLFFLYRRNKHLVSLYPILYTCSVCIVAFAAGSTRYYAASSLSPYHITHHAPYDELMSVGGVVQSVQSSPVGLRLVLNTHRVYHRSRSTPVKGRLLVTVFEPDAIPQPGEHVVVNGTMKYSLHRNPSDFDQPAYLRQKGIYASFTGKDVIPIARPQSLYNWFLYHIHRIRLSASTVITSSVDTRNGRVLAEALVLGKQDNMPASTREAFRATGLSHLLAVSGLHVMCVGFFFYVIIRTTLTRLGVGWKRAEFIRTCLTLVVLLSYAAITGLKPSIARAVLMAAVLMSTRLFHRTSHPLNGLFLAGLLLVALNPHYPFQAGFQLSFVAVLGLIVGVPVMNAVISPNRKGRHLLAYMSNSFQVSLVASLATLPVLLFHFGEASFAGIILNALAIPATMGLLIAAISLIVVYPFAPSLAHLFGLATDTLSHLLVVLAHKGKGLFQFATLNVPPFQEDILFASLLIATVWLCWNTRNRWRYLIVLLFFLCTLNGYSVIQQTSRPAMSVLFLDVGHGDATWLRLPGGKQLFIDTGIGTVGSAHTPVSRHAERWTRDCIDAVILTHPHNDHTGGLKSLIDQHCVNRVFTNTPPRYTIGSRPTATHQSPQVLSLMAGQEITIDPLTRIRVLSPTEALLSDPNVNNASIVLSIEYGFTRFLFLGDAELEAENSLVRHYASLLGSDVIKVGHHGSSTSSTPSFIDAVSTTRQPTYALISSGRNNEYGLPSGDVLARWAEKGIQVHRTAIHGALWLQSDGHEISVVKWQHTSP